MRRRRRSDSPALTVTCCDLVASLRTDSQHRSSDLRSSSRNRRLAERFSIGETIHIHDISAPESQTEFPDSSGLRQSYRHPDCSWLHHCFAKESQSELFMIRRTEVRPVLLISRSNFSKPSPTRP